MENIRYRYSALYKDFAESPELAKFRRYLDVWSWILYNETSDINQQIQECNQIIAEISGSPSKPSGLTVTDWHRAYVRNSPPLLKGKIENLTRTIRQYGKPHISPAPCCTQSRDVGKDLIMTRTIANLPDQSDIHAAHFAEMSNVFEDGLFGPTKEDADTYKQVPPHHDTCALKDIEEQDAAALFVLRRLKPANIFLEKQKKRFSNKPARDQDPARRQHIALSKVLLVLNILTGIYVPALFVACLAALSKIESENLRILVLGIFDLVLTASLVFCVPRLTRSQIFGITAAFSAVGGVYIGAKSDDRR